VTDAKWVVESRTTGRFRFDCRAGFLRGKNRSLYVQCRAYVLELFKYHLKLRLRDTLEQNERTV
jgi:hypothetical protein